MKQLNKYQRQLKEYNILLENRYKYKKLLKKLYCSKKTKKDEIDHRIERFLLKKIERINKLINVSVKV